MMGSKGDNDARTYQCKKEEEKEEGRVLVLHLRDLAVRTAPHVAADRGTQFSLTFLYRYQARRRLLGPLAHPIRNSIVARLIRAIEDDPSLSSLN